jgi:hypothetical protein
VNCVNFLVTQKCFYSSIYTTEKIRKKVEQSGRIFFSKNRKYGGLKNFTERIHSMAPKQVSTNDKQSDLICLLTGFKVFFSRAKILDMNDASVNDKDDASESWQRLERRTKTLKKHAEDLKDSFF